MATGPSTNPNFIRQEQLAPTGVHDSHMYDPNATDDRIVVMYETYERARGARDMLTQAGVSSDAIQVLHGEAEAGDTDGTRDDSIGALGAGLWGAVQSLFSAGEEGPQHGYAEGLHRGHALLAVKPPQGQRAEIVRLIASTEPVDFDAKLEEWRSAGWNGIYAERGASEPQRTATPGSLPTTQAAASATSSPVGRASDVVTTGEPKGSSGSAPEATGIAGRPNPR